jgi:hypothetical protein
MLLPGVGSGPHPAFNNGAKDSITSSLREVSGMIQNAIDFAFPLTLQPLAQAVFTEQLLLSKA